MRYIDVKNLLPNATHLYADVTQEQIDAVVGSKYVSELNGSKILGTLEPVEGLDEMIAGSISFG